MENEFPVRADGPELARRQADAPPAPRLVLYVDLNSYFATAAQQANPKLRGKPIGVCEHSGGIILAPSREAKLLGIKTAMPSWEAKKICSEIILVPVNPEQIRTLTSRFYRIAEEYSDKVEHASVDEVSIDLTGHCFSYEDAIVAAREIKQKMKEQMGEWMTASIGIGDSRLVAKIGTDLQKPNGLVLIVEDKSTLSEVEGLSGVKIFSKAELYDVLPLDGVPGIGSRLKKSLYRRGVTTLRQLSQIPVEVLHSWYGVGGVWLHDLSNFRDSWRYVDLDDRQIKSIGHQYSLSKKNALTDKRQVEGLLWKLAEKVTARLRAQGLCATGVSVYIGCVNGPGSGGSHRVDDTFTDTPTMVKVAEQIINKGGVNPVRNHARARAPGGPLGRAISNGVNYIHISVFDLVPDVRQGILFEQYEKSKKIPEVVDKINERFGDFSVMYAPTLGAGDKAGDTVGFGRTRERKDWMEEE